MPASHSHSRHLATVSSHILDLEHAGTFKLALNQLLMAPIAEETFTEICDGLPTIASFAAFHGHKDEHKYGHLVFELDHEKVCPGAYLKMHAFRLTVAPLEIDIPHWVGSSLVAVQVDISLTTTPSGVLDALEIPACSSGHADI